MYRTYSKRLNDQEVYVNTLLDSYPMWYNNCLWFQWKVDMDDLDINILVQTFSEKIGQLTTDLVVKEATIKQLNIKVTNLIAAMQPGKTEKTIKQTKTDNFEWGK